MKITSSLTKPNESKSDALIIGAYPDEKFNAIIQNADDFSLEAYCVVAAFAKTGVEMEALTAVQVGLLTIYDMCKAADRGMTMTGVRLLEKMGGKSGHWTA